MKEDGLRRTLALVALAAGLLTLGASPAGAITGNYQQDFAHPFVGLVAFYGSAGNFTHRCSGSLIAPSVFLTAGHCTDATTGATQARIWFEQDAGVGFDASSGTPAPSGYPVSGGVTSHALYNYGFANFAGFPDTHDVGLVILDQPIGQSKYASQFTSFPALAVAGSLNSLAKKRGQQDVTFTVSGYGLSLVNPVKVLSFRERLTATEKLNNLGSNLTDGFNVQTSASPGNGRGGTCSGDSGGPLLYSSTDTIVAVNSFGLNENCRGNDFMYRIDRQPVLDWILAHSPAGERGLIRIVSL
jgi:Trypsin